MAGLERAAGGPRREPGGERITLPACPPLPAHVRSTAASGAVRKESERTEQADGVSQSDAGRGQRTVRRGKSTIVAELARHHPQVVPIVTATTRDRRPGELDGVHYHFMDPEAFERLRDEGGLLEWAEVHGHWYGTPLDQIRGILRAGRDAILTIDPQGARDVRPAVPDALLIFVMPPSLEALDDRLSHEARRMRPARPCAGTTRRTRSPPRPTTTRSWSTRPATWARRPNGSGRPSRPRRARAAAPGPPLSPA